MRELHVNHHSFYNMKKRCYSKTNNRYEFYGGKGIKVCDEWKNSFARFCLDMGDKPTKNHSLDRIDLNGDYCKENCRWATDKEQANNKTNNVFISYNGENITLKRLAEITGVNYKLIHSRYRTKKTKDLDVLLKTKKPSNKYFINGERATAKDVANTLNISEAQLYYRVKVGLLARTF